MNRTAEHKNQRQHFHRLIRWIPITLQPKILGLKNRFLSRKGMRIADLCALGVTALLMAGLYSGTANTLRELERSAWSDTVAHSMLFGFSIGLFALIFLSAAVTGLSSLFMARDIDLLLSSPTRDTSFLRGKVLEVLVSTTWMILVFSIPPYIAFGQHLHGGVSFFTVAPLFVALFLLLAVLAGMTMALVCASMLPARTGRNVFAALFIIALSITIALVNARPEMGMYARLIGSSATPPLTHTINNPFLPSTWLADALLALSSKKDSWPIRSFALLCATIVALWGLLIVAFRKLYSRGYSRLHTQPTAFFLFSRSGKPRRRLLTLRTAQTTRALALRELFSFGRDLNHTIQLALFLTICILYFINFQNIAAPTHVGTWALRTWDLIAITSFITLSSLIILSICSRFVFPSVSLEGASLWILQIAPLTTRTILRAKYLTWAIPMGLICAVLFASAGLALALNPICIITLALSACIITHGLVALGVGLGARFSRFDWEHPAEISASWGNLLFLLAGLSTLALSFIPIIACFTCYVFIPDIFEASSNLLGLFASGLAVLLLINLIIGKIALKLGESALTRSLTLS
jgi:hypothetical protein